MRVVGILEMARFVFFRKPLSSILDIVQRIGININENKTFGNDFPRNSFFLKFVENFSKDLEHNNDRLSSLEFLFLDIR